MADDSTNLVISESSTRLTNLNDNSSDAVLGSRDLKFRMKQVPEGSLRNKCWRYLSCNTAISCKDKSSLFGSIGWLAFGSLFGLDGVVEFVTGDEVSEEAVADSDEEEEEEGNKRLRANSWPGGED
jgi:hypothetical protein